jgi:hypothetical protein
MKIKELDNMISEILTSEARKIIKEQVDGVDHLIDSIKSFQSLSGLVDKIGEIEDSGSDGPSILISIPNVTPEELVDCCGGDSLEHAETNLMQGLHHDLEDNGFDGDFDIDVDTSGDENSLNLTIRITPINDNTLNDVEEQTKDTNPTVDDKKDVILGGAQRGDFTGGDKPEGVERNYDGVAENKKSKNLNKMNETTKKKTITLNEEGMTELLKTIVSEAVKTMDPTTEKAIKDSGKQNNDALEAVEKKIKNYLSFKGNDNPEFPNQIGQGEEKAARQNSDEDDEVVSDNRGRGPQDLDYDTDGEDNNGQPGAKFQERLKSSLVGDSKMGNPADAANAIKTDVGEKMHKNIKKRQENLRKEPIYPKENVPVKQEKKEELRPVNEEIERMKQMASYNKKTQ